MKKIIIIIGGFLFLSSVYCQPIDKLTEDRVTQYVYEELTKQNFVKLNKVTREGKLSACELEYQYAYKDFRGKNGALINVNGAFAAMYNNEKTPSYSLKINTWQMDFLSEKWNIIEPAFTNIKINNIDFSKYKTIDFTCESGGKCTGYADNNLKLNLDVASTKNFEPEISFSLNKGGYDHLLKLSSLATKDKINKEFNGFRLCHDEIITMVADDFKKIMKK